MKRVLKKQILFGYRVCQINFNHGSGTNPRKTIPENTCIVSLAKWSIDTKFWICVYNNIKIFSIFCHATTSNQSTLFRRWASTGADLIPYHFGSEQIPVLLRRFQVPAIHPYICLGFYQKKVHSSAWQLCFMLCSYNIETMTLMAINDPLSALSHWLLQFIYLI